jgi:pilus assembly protein CpaF
MSGEGPAIVGDGAPWAALADELHAAVVAGRRAPAAPGEEAVRRHVAELARSAAPLLARADLDALVDAVASRTIGLGPLDPLLRDPAVTEVMVNGPGPVWVERAGAIERTDVVLGTSAIEHLIERIVGPLGLRVDRSAPLVDARLADGSRVNAVVPPLAVDGPCLTIRRFGARGLTLDRLCPPGVDGLLRWAVRARANLVVAGGTGAGKTTLLNALAGAIPATERIVTVEDAAELRLPGDHVVRLEARPANAEGAGEVTVRTLVRNALRMRPDRIIVGEVRGPEALDMLQAMNTGHEGSLSTCHANSPVDALRRLETMVLSGGVALPLDAVRDQVAAAVDLVVQVARIGGGARQVVAVDEVVARDGPGGALTVRRLAGPDGMVALPERPVRNGAAGSPDVAWLVR